MKKIIITVFLIIFLVTVYEIGSTYSLFETNNVLSGSSEIGKWVIKVNNNLVSEVENFTVDNFVVSSSPNVVEGKFAPSKTGYFDILIDPSDSQVSVKYEIFIDKTALINDCFEIASVSEINGGSLVETAKDTFTGFIPLSEVASGTIHTVRLNIIWRNDESNNYTDSIWGLQEGNVSMPVSVHLYQYLGEELLPYTS